MSFPRARRCASRGEPSCPNHAGWRESTNTPLSPRHDSLSETEDDFPPKLCLGCSCERTPWPSHFCPDLRSPRGLERHFQSQWRLGLSTRDKPIAGGDLVLRFQCPAGLDRSEWLSRASLAA